MGGLTDGLMNKCGLICINLYQGGGVDRGLMVWINDIKWR